MQLTGTGPTSANATTRRRAVVNGCPSTVHGQLQHRPQAAQHVCALSALHSHQPLNAGTTHQGGASRHRSIWAAAAAAAVNTETEASSSVSAESAQPSDTAAADTWAAAVGELQASVEGLGDSEAAEQLLRKAFGWTSQAFWRGTLVEAVPARGQVQEVVAYLHSLGLQGADLTKVVKTFPEVLACSIPDQLQVAVGKLQGEWRLQGDVLMRALVRRPQVLGYSVDCEGSCIGECNRCWARF